ncbi:hypothetical protein J4480_06665 [Candidatus Woesearchaeota archaeon]|nr:hypothetical protein [Candidatus Woesearchaeota archaeon]
MILALQVHYSNLPSKIAYRRLYVLAMTSKQAKSRFLYSLKEGKRHLKLV